MTDTAVVQEPKLQEHANETNNRRWRVSNERRHNATQVLKSAIIGQMIFHPLVAWLKHLYTTSAATNRLVNTAADFIDDFPY
jgi:hypothetical protein